MKNYKKTHSNIITKNRRKHIVLLFGGPSNENMISCLGAKSLIKYVDKSKYKVFPIWISDYSNKWFFIKDSNIDIVLSFLNKKDISILEKIKKQYVSVALFKDNNYNLFFLKYNDNKTCYFNKKIISNIDIFFPLLHGVYGEDGTIQGMLEMFSASYIGSRVLASAIGMDKEYMKIMFQSAGLKVLPYLIINQYSWSHKRKLVINNIDNQLSFPIYVKPARSGSSIGVSLVKKKEKLDEAFQYANQYDEKIILESALTNCREIECGLIEIDNNLHVSIPGEVVFYKNSDNDFYNFQNKYHNKGISIHCPPKLSSKIILEIQKQSKIAFKIIGARDLSRVDFFYTFKSGLFINEINTMPGFTSSSAYPLIWSKTGLSYKMLIEKLITSKLKNLQ